MSRTRCSASLRCSAEPGPTTRRESFLGPGSAAHHAAKSGAMRGIRGTMALSAVGWAKAHASRRAHHSTSMEADGGHAIGSRIRATRWLCPPYKVLRVPDAVQRLFALLRRAGTYHRARSFMGPGSAAHHAAKSGALRSIRGTTGVRALQQSGWMARHGRAEATPSFGRLCSAMSRERLRFARGFIRWHKGCQGMVG